MDGLLAMTVVKLKLATFLRQGPWLDAPPRTSEAARRSARSAISLRAMYDLINKAIDKMLIHGENRIVFEWPVCVHITL